MYDVTCICVYIVYVTSVCVHVCACVSSIHPIYDSMHGDDYFEEPLYEQYDDGGADDGKGMIDYINNQLHTYIVTYTYIHTQNHHKFVVEFLLCFLIYL